MVLVTFSGRVMIGQEFAVLATGVGFWLKFLVSGLSIYPAFLCPSGRQSDIDKWTGGSHISLINATAK